MDETGKEHEQRKHEQHDHERSLAQRPRRGFRPWLVVVALSVASAFIVPYLWLSPLVGSFAVYGFWTGFSLVVAGFIYWGVASWRDDE